MNTDSIEREDLVILFNNLRDKFKFRIDEDVCNSENEEYALNAIWELMGEKW